MSTDVFQEEGSEFESQAGWTDEITVPPGGCMNHDRFDLSAGWKEKKQKTNI